MGTFWVGTFSLFRIGTFCLQDKKGRYVFKSTDSVSHLSVASVLRTKARDNAAQRDITQQPPNITRT